MPDRPTSLDTIIDGINQQSVKEIEAVQKAAEREKELILRRTKKEVEQLQAELIARAETQADFVQKRVTAVAALEVKRLSLQAMTIIIGEILKQVKERLLKLRHTPEYMSLLKLMVFEGIRALNIKKVLISGGDREQVLLNAKILKSWETEINQESRDNVQLIMNQDVISDPGVILFSADKRLRFDNCLVLRVERVFEAHRWSVMQEFMDNNQQD
jgi:vacuolar-type H+-ATPase subunit E/Vma4